MPAGSPNRLPRATVSLVLTPIVSTANDRCFATALRPKRIWPSSPGHILNVPGSTPNGYFRQGGWRQRRPTVILKPYSSRGVASPRPSALAIDSQRICSIQLRRPADWERSRTWPRSRSLRSAARPLTATIAPRPANTSSKLVSSVSNYIHRATSGLAFISCRWTRGAVDSICCTNWMTSEQAQRAVTIRRFWQEKLGCAESSCSNVRTSPVLLASTGSRLRSMKISMSEVRPPTYRARQRMR